MGGKSIRKDGGSVVGFGEELINGRGTTMGGFFASIVGSDKDGNQRSNSVTSENSNYEIVGYKDRKSPHSFVRGVKCREGIQAV